MERRGRKKPPSRRAEARWRPGGSSLSSCLRRAEAESNARETRGSVGRAEPSNRKRAPMAASEWWCWPLPAWLGSGAAWFVVLNLVVGAIFALSSRAQPQSPSPRRGGSGSGITRRASSAVLQRIRSFNIFSFPSSGFHTAEPSPGAAATSRDTDDAGTTRRSPSTPRQPQPQAAAEVDDENSMSMDEAYALALAGRQRAPPTEEEAARSEVDAKAEEFIQGFKEDLRQQRLKSIFNYTQMLKRRAAVGRPAAAPE